MLKFVKYLGAFGWRPTVLTRLPTRFEAQDPSLLEELPSECKVSWTTSWDPAALLDGILWGRPQPRPTTRTRASARRNGGLAKRLWNLSRDWVLTPHPFWLWVPLAFREASRIIGVENVDVVFADSRISSVLALLLHRAYGIPFVVDYRNAWVGDPHLRMPTMVHVAVNEELEARVLRSAAAAVFLADSARQHALHCYPALRPERAFVISNGYDKDDFPKDCSLPREGPFTVGYVGSLYDEYIPVFRVFCRALRRLADEVPSNDVKLSVVGRVCKGARDVAAQEGLSGVTSFAGYVDHKAAVRFLLKAHVLLLLLDFVGPDTRISIPGKLYEYVASRRKIVLLGPPCETAAFIERYALGACAGRDVDRVYSVLSQWRRAFQAGRLELNAPSVAASCERKELAGKLASVLFFAVGDARRRSPVRVRGCEPGSDV